MHGTQIDHLESVVGHHLCWCFTCLGLPHYRIASHLFLMKSLYLQMKPHRWVWISWAPSHNHPHYFLETPPFSSTILLLYIYIWLSLSLSIYIYIYYYIIYIYFMYIHIKKFELPAIHIWVADFSRQTVVRAFRLQRGAMWERTFPTISAFSSMQLATSTFNKKGMGWSRLFSWW